MEAEIIRTLSSPRACASYITWYPAVSARYLRTCHNLQSVTAISHHNNTAIFADPRLSRPPSTSSEHTHTHFTAGLQGPHHLALAAPPRPCNMIKLLQDIHCPGGMCARSLRTPPWRSFPLSCVKALTLARHARTPCARGDSASSAVSCIEVAHRNSGVSTFPRRVEEWHEQCAKGGEGATTTEEAER